MAEDAKPAGTPGASDPSMEDILASIRRILNEDEPGTAPTPPGTATAAPATAATAPPMPTPSAAMPEAEAPLVLTEDMMVQPPAPPAPMEPEPPAPAASMPAAQPPMAAAPPPVAAGEGLLASATVAASAAALSQLMKAVNAQPAVPVYRGGGLSIEDVVREELRPMLKEWLDQHLPALVERLVQAEIARVVGRSIP